MKLKTLIEILQTNEKEFGNYNIRLILDHCISPETITVSHDQFIKEFILTQGNCGL